MGLGNFIGKITGAGGFDGGDNNTDFVDDTPTISSRYSDDFGYGTSSAKPSGSKVLSIAATTHLQVIVFKPQKYSEAAEIADHFKNKKTIVLNLENTNKDVANRLIDFLGGVAYAGDGDLKRISNTTYMIVPFNVEISGDTIEELESSSDLF
ncbi:MAG: cell division protein SepF [Oscillospiraceae bacterium]|nr:cell division protein SepF [Oscillospiraceae bacterium]